jgi:hypothetical protein
MAGWFRRALAALCIGVVGAAPAWAASGADHVLHSDLPLWGVERDDPVWPRFFENEDGFGCSYRLEGDWTYVNDDWTYPIVSQWARFTNQGGVHCFMKEVRASDQASLDGAIGDFALLVELGRAAGPDGEVELWALQSGTAPGSTYTLLARKPEPGMITSFDVLEMECPRGRLRKGRSIDIKPTDYCVINSRREIRDLARRMAKRPHVLKLVIAPSETAANP